MAQPASREKKPAGTKADSTVGEILRRTRLHYDQSIEDIERALRIKAAQITAMETNNFENLPGRTYAIGFVRSYSEYLGLDGDKMVSLFKSQIGTVKTALPELNFPVSADDSKTPRIWVVSLSLVTALGILLYWLQTEAHDRAVVTEVPPVVAVSSAPQPEQSPPVVPAQAAGPFGPPVPAEITADGTESVASAAVAEAPAATPQAETAQPVREQAPVEPAVPPAPNLKGRNIILKIVQNSWVEIKDSSGKAIVSRVLNAGDKYFVPARADLYMSLGNSAGVQIEIDGQRLNSLGGPGQVLRNIPLDADLLKKKFSRNIVNDRQ